MSIFALPPATNGDIALINHRNILDRCWYLIQDQPNRHGPLEQLVDEENKRIQFLGDVDALGRLSTLSKSLLLSNPNSPRTFITSAQVLSSIHHFSDARAALEKAKILGADANQVENIALAIDQATWEDLPRVLKTREENASKNHNLVDWVLLGALQAEIGLFQESSDSFMMALNSYKDLSPFPLAWVCFQQGKLWGEQVEDPNLELAHDWYQRAISYIPSYVHARVHLSEIYLEWGRLEDAQALLRPIADVSDPEINWRMGQIAEAMGNQRDAHCYFSASDKLYRRLIDSNKAAFADHGAEFYMDSGNDHIFAFELANFNFECRQTLRSFNLLCEAGFLAFQDKFEFQDILSLLKIKWQNYPNAKAYKYETNFD